MKQVQQRLFSLLSPRKSHLGQWIHSLARFCHRHLTAPVPSFSERCSKTWKCWSLDKMIKRLHHREHKCKHYPWVCYFAVKVQYKPFFFSPNQFFCWVVFFFCSFIKAHTIKYVQREVRNVWKHLKKNVNVRLRVSWVCWRHSCYSTGNVSSHFSSPPMQNPILDYSAPRVGRYPWKLRAFRI